LTIRETKRHSPLGSECRHGLPRGRIERVEILAANGEDALLSAAVPVVDATRRRAARIFARGAKRLLPDRFPGFAIQRHHQAVRVLRVEHAIHHDRRRAQVGVWPRVGKRGDHLGVDGGAPPRHAQVAHGIAIDLCKGRIPSKALVATEVAPIT
jgi:hypothetical protein